MKKIFILVLCMFFLNACALKKDAKQGLENLSDINSEFANNSQQYLSQLAEYEKKRLEALTQLYEHNKKIADHYNQQTSVASDCMRGLTQSLNSVATTGMQYLVQINARQKGDLDQFEDKLLKALEPAQAKLIMIEGRLQLLKSQLQSSTENLAAQKAFLIEQRNFKTLQAEYNLLYMSKINEFTAEYLKLSLNHSKNIQNTMSKIQNSVHELYKNSCVADNSAFDAMLNNQKEYLTAIKAQDLASSVNKFNSSSHQIFQLNIDTAKGMTRALDLFGSGPDSAYRILFKGMSAGFSHEIKSWMDPIFKDISDKVAAGTGDISTQFNNLLTEFKSSLNTNEQNLISKNTNLSTSLLENLADDLLKTKE